MPPAEESTEEAPPEGSADDVEPIAETAVPPTAEAAAQETAAQEEAAEPEAEPVAEANGSEAPGEEAGEAQEGESVEERPDSPDDLDQAAGEDESEKD